MERLQVFINGKRTLNERKSMTKKGGTNKMRKTETAISYKTYKEWRKEERKQNISAFFGGLIMMLFIFGMIAFYIKFGYVL